MARSKEALDSTFLIDCCLAFIELRKMHGGTGYWKDCAKALKVIVFLGSNDLAAIRDTLIACDSELSAIASGRPPSSKEELYALAGRCRKLTS